MIGGARIQIESLLASPPSSFRLPKTATRARIKSGNETNQNVFDRERMALDAEANRLALEFFPGGAEVTHSSPWIQDFSERS